MYLTKTVTADSAGVDALVEIVSEALQKCKVKNTGLENALALTKETASALANHAPDGSKISVLIYTLLGKVSIEINVKGEKFDFSECLKNLLPKAEETEKKEDSVTEENADNENADALSRILLKSMGENVHYRNLFGMNRVILSIQRPGNTFIFMTLGAMVLGIGIGMLLILPYFGMLDDYLDLYVFVPVKTMYMNALKMVVAPVVFFSIVSSIAHFSDTAELGRLGGRVISIFMCTTILAVGVGIGVFFLLKPGVQIPDGAVIADAQEITSQTMDVSIKDMIVGIVPSDFVEPFVSSNMLQLIFLAVVCGIAAGMIGRYSETVKNLFEAFNELFLKITTLIIRFMPVAVFCSICSTMMNLGIKTMLSVLQMFGTFLLGLLGLLCVYSTILLLFGRVNPFKFFKNYIPTMIQVFSMASSNASIPLNMEACEKLGVPRKIYSLSIPLGATINMDGTCVHLAVFSLALAKTNGIEITGSMLFAVIVAIIVLSMGAPGIPGSGLICLSVLLSQMGVPTEAIGLVMGIDALVGMFRCMNNCTGDVVASMVVARKEKVLRDMKL